MDNKYCKGKRVSCIKFHPQKSYLVAMSMVDNMDFDTRSLIQGKSFESHLLILNFSDSHIISLNFVLESPIEVTAIEFHPENCNVLVGGCLNGQVIVWDLSSVDHRIAAGPTPKLGEGGGGDDEGFSSSWCCSSCRWRDNECQERSKHQGGRVAGPPAALRQTCFLEERATRSQATTEGRAT